MPLERQATADTVLAYAVDGCVPLSGVVQSHMADVERYRAQAPQPPDSLNGWTSSGPVEYSEVLNDYDMAGVKCDDPSTWDRSRQARQAWEQKPR